MRGESKPGARARLEKEQREQAEAQHQERHGQIDASDIEVSVENREVTLSGTVRDRRTKRMAEDAIDSIYGVKDVYNQLRVQEQQGGTSAWHSPTGQDGNQDTTDSGTRTGSER